MNKKILKVITASALVATMATSAMAEDTQFGVGVSVAGNNSTTIRGTISLEDGMRLEPFFGFSYLDPTQGDSTTDISVGTAFHMTQMINNKINAYYGGFAGIQNYDNGTYSATILNLGPVAGVEYALDQQFTLGAEVRVNIGLGDDTSFGTDSSVLVRYYF